MFGRDYCWIAVAVACVALIGCQGTPRPEVAEMDEEGRLAELERLEKLVQESQGDAEYGRTLFASRCGACHTLHDAGEGAAGPDLTPYLRDEESVGFLLESIALPDARLHPYHTKFEIRTREGVIVNGVMQERDEQGVTLIDAAGDVLTIPREEIEWERPLYASLMPNHLLAQMTDQQIVDLFAFLLSDGQR